ncbi:MAG: DHA2 family efflux MFS transporter permease subunit [Deltaproteobacteria bacterium]|nr:DHA2 family efflux MFS transporter permease subunit [Candidatus Zymogenaceae bacterium]
MTDKTQIPPNSATDSFYKWEILALAIFGSFMAILDSSIVNVALPHLMVTFSANLEQIEWVSTGYMLAFAILMPATTWLRDAIGLRNAFALALLVFTGGSALCGLAWDLDSLIFFRVIQAVGGGALMPTGLTMVSEVFPPSQRGMALGIWGAGATVAPALGPTVGGYLLDFVNWRAIFYINIPIGAVVIALTLAIMRHGTGHRGSYRFDFFGFIFLSIALAGLLIGLTQGEREGWTSAYILTLFAVSYFAFFIFLIVESIVEHPIVDLRIFKIRNFSITCLLGAARSIALFSSVFLMPLFLQRLLGYSAFDTGLLLMPSALAVAITMPLAGNLTDRIGPKAPYIIGGLVTAYSFFIYSELSLNSSYGFMLYGLILRGAGMGFLMAPITVAAMNAVPQKMMSLASGLLNLIMQLSAAFGIAIFGAFLTRRQMFHQEIYVTYFTPDNTPLNLLIAKVKTALILSGSTLDSATTKAYYIVTSFFQKWAASNAYDDCFLVSAVIIFVCSFLVFLLEDIYPRKGLFGHFKSAGKLTHEHFKPGPGGE